jgi:hypothetical protein
MTIVPFRPVKTALEIKITAPHPFTRQRGFMAAIKSV